MDTFEGSAVAGAAVSWDGWLLALAPAVLGVVLVLVVPVLPVAIDYGRREVRFLPLFTPTADMAADHAALAALFRGIEPKHKHRLSLPLREAQMAETD